MGWIKAGLRLEFNAKKYTPGSWLKTKGGYGMVKKNAMKPIRMKKDPSGVARQAIKKLYNKSAPMLLFEALLFFAASVLLFIKPVAILATSIAVFGIVLAFVGLYQLFVGLFGEENEMSGKTMNIILGGLKIILGAIFFIQPSGSMITIIYVLAILFLIKATVTLVFSVRIFKAKFGSVMDLLTSAVMIALGVLILFFPKFGLITAMYFIAITLLFYATVDIGMYVRLLRLKKMVS
jgi:uncharacterized membrane protein HdeD (DUF308 family)